MHRNCAVMSMFDKRKHRRKVDAGRMTAVRMKAQSRSCPGRQLGERQATRAQITFEKCPERRTRCLPQRKSPRGALAFGPCVPRNDDRMHSVSFGAHQPKTAELREQVFAIAAAKTRRQYAASRAVA